MSTPQDSRRRSASPAWVLADLYSAGGLIYLVCKLIFGNRMWPVALLDNLAAWLLLPALPLLALAGWRRRWLRAVHLALVSAGFVWLFGDLFLPRSAPPPVCASPADGCVPRLRVMAFNMLNEDSDPALVVEEIRRADADIVGLTEYTKRKAAVIDEMLSDVYPYRLQYEDGIPGIGLLSKYPITSAENFSVEFLGLSHIHAVLSVDGVPLEVYVGHPPPPAFFPRYTARGTRDITELAYRATSSGGPALLIGDFNTADISDDYRRIAASGLYDAFREAGYGIGPTWPATRWGIEMPTVVRIDYVWHTRHFVATRAWVGGRTGSDHLPVIAELAWR